MDDNFIFEDELMPNITIDGILSYPSLMKPTTLESFPNNPSRYRCTVLIKRGSEHHQNVMMIIDQLKREKWSKGIPSRFEVKCIIDMIHDDDLKMRQYIAIKALNSEFDRPRVIDQDGNEVIDVSILEPGRLCKMSASIYPYVKSGDGISAGINGVMIMKDMGELGRLGRNRLTDDQMFGRHIDSYLPVLTTHRIMTEKAVSVTYQQFIDNGWTDDLLVKHGYLSNLLLKGKNT